VVVPGDVRELRLAGDVPHGVDPRSAGPVPVVRPDETAGVETHAGGVAAEIVRVRPAPGRDEKVGGAELAAVLENDEDVAPGALA